MRTTEKQQKEFLDTVLESLTHPFYVVDVDDYTIKLHNKAAVSGKLSDNVTCYALTHKRTKPCGGVDRVCPLEEVKRTGKPIVAEHIHYDEDDNERNVEVHGFPILRADGKVTQMIEYCLDITERKRLEEKLRFLSSITQRVTDSIMITNLNYEITYVNEAAEALFGYKLKELLGKRADLFNAEPLAKSIQEDIYRAVSAGEIWMGTILNRRKDGSTFFCEAKISPLLDESGQITSYVGVQRDITEHKQAEDEVYKLLSTIETTLEAISITSPKGIITYTNKAMDELFGYEKGELIGQYPSVLNAGRAPKATTNRIIESIEKDGHWEEEIQNIRKNGTEFTSYAKISALKDDDGKIINILSTQHDITERKRFMNEINHKEHQIRNLARAYVHAQEEERLWISLEIHDRIVQPLFTIQQQIEQLKSKVSGHSGLCQSIGDCLILMKEVGLDTRKVMYHLYPSILTRYGLVRMINDELSELEGITGCQTKLSVQNNLMLDSNTETTFYRILHEALHNVRKHASARNVKVSLKYRNSVVELKVEDDGIGFDVNEKEKEVCVGLESMRQRTEIVGGSFKVTSTPGAGTSLVSQIQLPNVEGK